MYCHQCEQTAKGEACTKGGVCGKPHDVATLQDLLIHAHTGVSAPHRARTLGVIDREVDVFTVEALFTTMTNVNFDAERLVALIGQAIELRDGLSGTPKPRAEVPRASTRDFQPAPDPAGLIAQGEKVGIKSYPAANAGYPVAQAHPALRHQGRRGLRRPRPDPRPGRRRVYAFIHEATGRYLAEKT